LRRAVVLLALFDRFAARVFFLRCGLAFLRVDPFRIFDFFLVFAAVRRFLAMRPPDCVPGVF
jgi:hypothetical protein